MFLEILLRFLLGSRVITSAVSIAFLKLALISFAVSFISSIVYFLFILLRVSLQPLCKDKWKCGHIFSKLFSLSINLFDKSPMSSDPKSYSFYSALFCLSLLISQLNLYLLLNLFHMMLFVSLSKLLLLFQVSKSLLSRL